MTTIVTAKFGESKEIKIAPGSFRPQGPSLLIVAAIDDPTAMALYLEMTQRNSNAGGSASQERKSTATNLTAKSR